MKQTLRKISTAIVASGVLLASSTAFVFACFTDAECPIAQRCELAPGGAPGVCKSSGFFFDFGLLLNQALDFVLVIGALMVFMYLIWGGIDWITSGGDKSKTESARNKITAAVIGLIVLAAAWAILELVLAFLGAGSFANLLKRI